jgi:UDP-2-acetamido-3-amino-2,3-dideoxy-glucuronate N-acetyltransferase
MTSAEIHPTAVCEPGCVIGERTRIWHFVHVGAGAKIGRDCSIGQGCYVAATAVIGDCVRVQNHVSVYDGVILEDDVFCGPGVVFTNVKVPRSRYPKRSEYTETRVRRGATLGANATIVCGAVLGEYCFVGAGAVVTADVLPHAMVLGVPARPVAWVSVRGERLQFDERGVARCPVGGERYILEDGQVVRQAPSAG